VQRLPRGRHRPYAHDIRIDPRHAPRNDATQGRGPQGPGALVLSLDGRSMRIPQSYWMSDSTR